jgi:glycosyltransferase involved in cell wall biosynthesis
LSSGAHGDKRLFLDATSALRWGPSVPTGIPRVEASLISECLKSESDRIDLFAFDPTIRRCRMLTENEKAFVQFVLRPSPVSHGLSSWRERVRRAYSAYKLNVYCASRETYRSIAQELLGASGRSGIAQDVVKVAVMIVFWFVRTWRSIVRPTERRKHSDPLVSGEARCLLSINTSPFIAKYYAVEDIGCQLLILNYDTIPLDYPDYASRGHAERFRRYFSSAMSLADEVICISQATRRSTEDWCARLGIETAGKRLQVVQVASPLAFNAIGSLPIEELRSRRFVLYCSTIEPRKNHQMLFEVWARLCERHGRDTMPLLVLVGKWGWRVDNIKKSLRGSGHIGSSVRVYAFLPDEQLIWLYENALFSVFPSFVEGWGLAASESLDFGTPVLVSDAPALGEATQGLMPKFDRNDAHAWEQGIAELIFDEGARTQLREKIRRHYVRRSPADVFREIAAILADRSDRDL